MWRVFFLIGLFWWSIPIRLLAQPTPDPTKPANANWAEDFLANDPLSAKDDVTLDDIRNALNDAGQRDTVLERHWPRLRNVSLDQKKAFLVELLKHDSRRVQSQAASQLGGLGLLEEVVATLLSDFLRSDEVNLREAAIVALTHMKLGAIASSDEYWTQLIESLDSQSDVVRDASMQQLESAGDRAVPMLIEAMRDSRSNVRLRAAEVLSRIVGSKPRVSKSSSEPAATRPDTKDSSTSNVAPSPPKSSEIAPIPHQPREVEPKNPKQVRVYFGTNRERLEIQRPAWSSILLLAGLGLVMFVAVVSLWRYPSDKVHINSCSTVLLTVLMCLACGWAFISFRDQLLEHGKLGTGQKFGPRRDVSNLVHYGYCDVSIPLTHLVGELEGPLFSSEDEEKHVILRHTEEMKVDDYFELVHSELEKLDPSSRSCFIFIHGFNVSFEKAARRTAQIHHDLKFAGKPIFFSWPSRASMHHYFSDRNEIEFSRYVIKQFLLDVADRVKSDRIHVIAHSMGADATCRAIAEMGERGKIFDQIILAAPDIDRDVFRVQLVPRIAKTANRITLYCSGSDLALHVSYTFNDAPRAGDSSRGILVAPEIDTIDASGIDTDLLGHSYYGDCVPILSDVQLLFDQNLSPDQRPLKPWPFDELLKYWTFDLSNSSTAPIDKNPSTSQ